MAIQKTNAIILKTQPFRSTSLVVNFFSREHGKVKGIAKGVRQEREMRGSLFELFTQVEIIYYEKIRTDLHLISDAFILESYESIRSRLETISMASYFSDLVDQLTEFHDPHPALFDLLHFVFSYLPALPPERLSRLFEIKLLEEIGWLPFVNGCVKCHEKGCGDFYFSPNQGALYCKNCCSDIRDAKPISQETLSVLRYYIEHEPEMCLKLPMTARCEQGLGLLMELFLNFRLHKPLKSKLFLEKIKPILP